jgi:hypothetical protein
MAWFSGLLPKGPIGFWLTANPGSKKTLRVDASGQVTAEDIAAAEVAGLGTAATRDVPSSGNASSTQVVLGNDSRLGGGGGSTLEDTAVQTTAYTAGTGQNVLLNASGMQASANFEFSVSNSRLNFTTGLPEVGTEVTVSNTSAAYPGGISPSTRYFLVNITGTVGGSGWCNLSLTRGGSTVAYTVDAQVTDPMGQTSVVVISKQVQLPNSPSVGQTVRFTMDQANNVRSWLPHFNGSTVNGLSDVGPYRLTQVGEWIEFVCTGSNAWRVVGQQRNLLTVTGLGAARTLTDQAFGAVDFTSAALDVSGMLAANRIVIRRSGRYDISGNAAVSTPHSGAAQLIVSTTLNGDGTGSRLNGQGLVNAWLESSGPQVLSAVLPSRVYALSAGDVIGMIVFRRENNGSTRSLIAGTVVNGTFLSVSER